jgi:hypothetical protein
VTERALVYSSEPVPRLRADANEAVRIIQ